jgi:gliding motility-associated-like protein
LAQNQIYRHPQGFSRPASGMGRARCLLVALLWAVFGIGYGQTSIATGNWSEGSTWNTGVTPTGMGNVIIDSGDTVTLDVPAACNELTVRSGAKLQITAFDFTVNGTTRNTGEIHDNDVLGRMDFGRVINESNGIFNLTLHDNSDDLRFYDGIEQFNTTPNSFIIGFGKFRVNDQTISGQGDITFMERCYVEHLITITNNLTGDFFILDEFNGVSGSEWINGANSKVIYSNNKIDKPFTPGTLNLSTFENTFVYSRDDDQDIAATDYYHLELKNGGTKTLTGHITVYGDLTIANGTTLDVDGTNNHSIILEGDWNNNGIFNEHEGFIMLSGSVDQDFSCSSIETFYGLVLNKSSGDFILNNDLVVSNSFFMSSGNVDALTSGSTLYLSNGTETNLTYNSGAIIGNLERAINSTAVYRFPVGTDSSLHQFNLKPSGISTSGSAVVRFNATDPGGTGLPISDGGQTIYHQFPEGYWSVSAKNSLSLSGYEVELSGTGFTTYTTDADTRVLIRDNAGDWTDPVPGSHGPSLKRTGLSALQLSPSATEFGLGHTSCELNIDAQPSNVLNQCPGATIKFGVQASGGGAIAYQWYKSPDVELTEGGGITGTTSDTLALANIDISDAGDYYCVVRNGCDTLVSDTVSLGMETTKPVPACTGDKNVNTNNACTYVHADNTWNATATDNCSAAGDIAITYNLYTATSATGLTTLNGQAFNLGTTHVRAIAQDEAGNIDSCSFKVVVADDDLPVPACTGDKNVNTNNACAYVHADNTWNATATDNCSAAGDIAITYNLYTATSATGLTTLNGQAFNLGTTHVRAIAQDEAGNIDSCSFKVVVADDDLPVPACTGDKNVNTNNACAYVHADNTWNATATDNCSAAGDIAITYNLYTATSATGLTTLNGQAFNLGTTHVRAIAQDEAGNIDSCSFKVVVADDDLPVPACTGDKNVNTNNACTYVHADNTWNATATDNCSAAGDIAITYNLYTATSATGLTTLNGQAFNLGTTHVRAIAQDEAGNIDSCSFKVVVADDDLPVPACTGDKNVNTNNACAYVHADNTWNATATDNCSAAGDIAITYNLYTATSATGLTTLNGQAFNLGTTHVRAIAQDEAGNIDSCSFKVVVADDDLPVPACTGDKNVNTNNACAYVHADNTWNATATDNCSAAGDIAITYNLYTATSATGLTTLNGQAFNLGTTHVRAIAQDEAGNIDSCSFKVVVADDDLPVPACTGDKNVNTNNACAYVHADNTWNATATDNCSAAGDIAITYNLYTATSATGLTTLNGQAFNLGTTHVRAIAQDEAGNIDSCSFKVVVADGDLPVPACTGDKNVNTNNACAYVHADNTWNATATDNCSAAGDIAITYNLYTATSATGLTTLNGQAFNLGTTHVRAIAQDEAGNIDSCSFKVVVADDDLPVPACTGDKNVNTNNACAYVHADNTWNATATDNCSAAGDIAITYNLYTATSATGLTTLNGQAFNLGTTHVRAIAQDEAGNIDSCSFKVVVADDDLPVPACTGDKNVNTNNACAYVHADNTWNATATDNCSAAGDIAITYNLYTATSATGLTTLNGQAFNLGTTHVRAIAQDEAGNIDSCSFKVVVADGDLPTVITFPTFIAYIDPATGIATIDTNDIDNGSLDNCGIASRSLDITSFDCGDITTSPHTVTLTVRDVAGNESTGTSQVTVAYNPNPAISAALVTDTAICSGDSFAISLISNYDSTRYTWSIAAHDDITGESDGQYDPMDGDTIITQTLVNNGDTARRVAVTITPQLFHKCNEADTTLYFWVEPGIKVALSASDTTLCSSQSTDIQITSKSITSQGLRFNYHYAPVNPADIDIHYFAADDTLAREKGYWIRDTLINLSKQAQLVNLIATPYTIGVGPVDLQCPGTNDTTTIWVEPDIAYTSHFIRDTICNGGNAFYTFHDSGFVSTHGLEFEYKTYCSSHMLTGCSEIPVFNIQPGQSINDSLFNTSDTVHFVRYTLYAFLKDENGNTKCPGDSIVYEVYVEPEPAVQLFSMNEKDSLCNGGVTEIHLHAGSASTHGIKFNYTGNVIDGHSGDVQGITSMTGVDTSYVIRDTLVNLTDTCIRVVYAITPYSLKADSITKKCDGKTFTDTVVVEPAFRLGFDIVQDTLCNQGFTSVEISTIYNTKGDLRFRYTASLHNELEWHASGDTTGLALPYTFADSLVNTGDTARKAVFYFTPYTTYAGKEDEKCTGPTDSVVVWVEPTLVLNETLQHDTICNKTATHFKINTNIVGTNGVTFDYWVINPPAAISGYTDTVRNVLAPDSITDVLVNTADSLLELEYRVVAWLRDASGNRSCQSDTLTAKVVVQPTAYLLPQDGSLNDTICDSSIVGLKYYTISKSVHGILYNYSGVPAIPGAVTGFSSGTDTDTSVVINDMLVNHTDTAQMVVYTITPYSLDPQSNCPGLVLYDTLWVEPTPKVVATPLVDTICNDGRVSIALSSPSGPTREVRFRYMVDGHPDIDVVSDSLSNFGPGDRVTDSIHNASDTARMVRYTFTAYTRLPSGDMEKCAGLSQTVDIWVEPTPKVVATPTADTICNNDQVQIVLSSPSDPTREVRFKYSIAKPGSVVVYADSLFNYRPGDTITDQIQNNTDSAQLVQFTFTAYTRGAGSDDEKCTGESTTVDIWVEPSPKVWLAPTHDTICNNDVVEIILNSPTRPTHPVRFNATFLKEHPGVHLAYSIQIDSLHIGDTLRFSLDNTTDSFQFVQVIVLPYTFDTINGNSCVGYQYDTTKIWVEPSPKAVLSQPDSIVCSNDRIALEISSPSVPTKDIRFTYSTEQQSGITIFKGDTFNLTNNYVIQDSIINTTDSVLWVKYFVTPYTRKPHNDSMQCEGVADSVLFWVNPTPKLQVSVMTDTLLCDSSTLQIDITDLNGKLAGDKVFTLTVDNPGGVLGVQPAGEYDADTTSFTDRLVNPTNQVQVVKYTFRPRIDDPRNLHAPFCDNGRDTTITIYVNPTPKMAVSVPDTILCDNDDLVISITDLNGTVAGDKVFVLDVENTGGVLGVQLAGEYDADTTSFTDKLVNNTNQVQVVKYTFRPRIDDPRSGGIPFCDNGRDTTITIYVNPTPKMAVSVPDTIICDSGDLVISIADLNGPVAGDKVFVLDIENTGGVIGVQPAGEYDADTISFTDRLMNPTDEVQVVKYTFRPRIDDPRSGHAPFCDNGKDTTLTIFVNPTPKMAVSVPDTIICDNDDLVISITDLNGTVAGDKVFVLDVENTGGVLGVQLAGEYDADTTSFTDKLVNNTNQVQVVKYTFRPRIDDPRSGGIPFCDNGRDTTLTIYVNPTPKMAVSVPDTIICDNDDLVISIADLNGPVAGDKVFVLDIENTGGVLGVQPAGEYDADTILFTDRLVNPTDQVQVVKYTFRPRIDDPRSGHAPFCDNGKDTTLTIYVNPTPKMAVSVPDTIICDNDDLVISIADLNVPVAGDKVFILSIDNPGGVLGVQPAGEYDADTTSFTDKLVNPTNQVQVVKYTFRPRIDDPRSGGIPFCDNGRDTTLTIYVNPTPKMAVSVPDTIICDNDDLVISIADLNGPVAGDKVFILSIDNPGGILGVQPAGEYDADTTSFTDRLVNPTDQVQVVKYTFRPRIDDPRNLHAPFCDNGKDTTITIYVNPTPKMAVSVPDTILCDNDELVISIADLNVPVAGDKVFILSIDNPGGVLGVQPAGEYDADTTSFTDKLVNPTNQVQVVKYTFRPRIDDPRSGGIPFCDNGRDTTLTIYVNPTPKMAISVPDTIICDNDDLVISIADLNGPVAGDKVFILSIDNPGGILGVQPAGEYDADTTSFTDRLVNPTDQVQVVKYTFRPRIDDPRNLHAPFCDNGRDTSITVFVEPTPKVSVSVLKEVICNETHISISISSPSQPYQEVRFRYQPINLPSGISVVNDSTFGFSVRDTIQDQIINSTDSFRYVSYVFYPYTRYYNSNLEKCTGIPDTVTFVVEPTPRILYSLQRDTLCNGASTDFVLSSPTVPRFGREFKYMTEADNPALVSGTQPWQNGLQFNLDNHIVDPLTNLRTDTFNLNTLGAAQNVNFIFNAYLLDAGGQESCNALNDTNKVLVLPTLYAVALSDTGYGGVNIFCKGESTGSIQTGIYGGYNAVTGFVESNNAYLWTGLGATTKDLSGLPIGNYHIDVTDKHLCTASDQITLVEPDSILLGEISIIDSLECNITDRAILKASANGGIRDYSVEWYLYGELEHTEFIFPDREQGPYYAILYDANMCSYTTNTITLSRKGSLDAIAFRSIYQGRNVSCHNASDGNVTVIVKGKVSLPLHYSVKGPGVDVDTLITDASNANLFLDNLSAGTYSLFVNDPSDCAYTGSFNITQPPPLEILVDSISEYGDAIHVSCFGLNDGSIDLKVTGDRGAPYQFLWTTDDGTITGPDNTEDLENLPVGTYSLKTWKDIIFFNIPLDRLDTARCEATAQFTLKQPDLLKVEASSTPITCFNYKDATITLDVEGGYYEDGYNYLWNDNVTTRNRDSLGHGTYTVWVSDDNQCTDSATVFLEHPDTVMIDTLELSKYVDYNISCYGENDGNIKVLAFGGNGGPYQYTWESIGGPELLHNDLPYLDNLVAGRYELTVQDPKGCTGFFAFGINEPNALRIEPVELKDITCHAYDNGSIEIEAIGGMPPYRYAWSNNQNTPKISNLRVGEYTLMLTDSNQCSAMYTASLIKEDSVHLLATLSDYNGFNISCKGLEDGSIDISIVKGEGPYEYTWNQGTLGGDEKISGLAAGDYHIMVKDGRNCLGSLGIELIEPDLIIAPASVETIRCFGEKSGKITVHAKGGAAPYTYFWADSVVAQDSFALDLSTGTYPLTLKDANGCGYDTSYQVYGVPELKVDIITEQQPTCSGLNDGKIIARAKGGVGGFEFRWSNKIDAFSPDSNNFEITDGRYHLTVKDGNGCRIFDFIELKSRFPHCFEVYNAFTPNGDGINDFWEIDAYDSQNDQAVSLFELEMYQDAVIKIFDRWGKKVAEITNSSVPVSNPSAIWDGTLNGELLPYDTYYYVIDLDPNGRLSLPQSTMAGTITLIRMKQE